MTIQTIKDAFLKYWFAASTLILAVLYLLYDRRGRTIQELQDEAQKQMLAQKLLTIRDKAQRSDDDAIQAKQDYEDLKRRHADLIQRYGVGPDTTPEPPSAA